MLRRQVANGHADNDNYSEEGNIIPGITQPVSTWNDNSPPTPLDPRRSADIYIYAEEGDTSPATTRNGNDRFTPVHVHRPWARSVRVIQTRHQTPSPGTRRAELPSGVQPAEPPPQQFQVVSPRAQTYQGLRDVQTSHRGSPGTWPIAQTPLVAQNLAQASAVTLTEVQGPQHSQRRLHRSQTSQFVQPGVQGLRGSQPATVDDAGIVVTQNAPVFTLDSATSSSQSSHLHRSQTLQFTQPGGQGLRGLHPAPAAGAGVANARHTSATIQDSAMPSPGARPPLQPMQQTHSQVRNIIVCQQTLNFL